VVFTVIDFRTATQIEVLRYRERLKARLEKKLDQLETLNTVQELLAI
jgi:hypothetical protein